MAERRDMILGDDGDLVIRNGDVVFGPAMTDDVGLLLLTNPGEHMLDPLCGIGLVRLLNSRTDRARIEAIVRKQVERDGLTWDDVRDGVKLNVDNG